MTEMKPVYQVKAWRDGDRWLARVVGASDGADRAPVNAETRADTLAKVDPMARDLIATILDAAHDTFDYAVDYDLPDAGRPTKNGEPPVLSVLHQGFNF
jgi:hypothetical protein